MFHGNTSLDIDEYMEVVELYTFGVLGKDTNDVCLAVSWVEQAALSEERRQVQLNIFMCCLLSMNCVPTKSNLCFREF